MFTVAAPPSTAFVKQLEPVQIGRRLQHSTAGTATVRAHFETRAANPDAVRALTTCLQAATVRRPAMLL